MPCLPGVLAAQRASPLQRRSHILDSAGTKPHSANPVVSATSNQRSRLFALGRRLVRRAAAHPHAGSWAASTRIPWPEPPRRHRASLQRNDPRITTCRGLSRVPAVRVPRLHQAKHPKMINAESARPASAATGNVRLVSTESESAIEPPTYVTGSRPRTARTGITADPGINSQPTMTPKARDQPGVSSALLSSAARIWLSHSVPSWRPFGSWSPRSQRHVVIIASTRIRHSRSKPWLTPG
jgi:hypothetical protein